MLIDAFKFSTEKLYSRSAVVLVNNESARKLDSDPFSERYNN